MGQAYRAPRPEPRAGWPIWQHWATAHAQPPARLPGAAAPTTGAAPGAAGLAAERLSTGEYQAHRIAPAALSELLRGELPAQEDEFFAALAAALD